MYMQAFFYRRGAEAQSLNVSFACRATHIKDIFLFVSPPLRFKKFFVIKMAFTNRLLSL